MLSSETAEVAWTNESVVQLVQEYCKLPELWDRNHDLHHVQTAKYEAWTSLARLFGCDIAELRKKITSILASYRREKGKVRKGAQSTWFLYPHLKFLSGYLKSPAVVKKRPPEPMQELYTAEIETDQEDDDEQVIQIKQEPDKEPSPMKIPSRFAGERHNQRLTRRKHLATAQTHTHTDSKLLEMLRLLKKSDISRKKDECDSFGEYIATSLRKHDDRTQSMIKQAINNILFEQEMKKYSSYSAAISPENPLGGALDDTDDSQPLRHH